MAKTARVNDYKTHWGQGPAWWNQGMSPILFTSVRTATEDDERAGVLIPTGTLVLFGAHLAEIELAEALKLTVQRMPDIHRVGDAPWNPVVGISGPTTLPVELDTV